MHSAAAMVETVSLAHIRGLTRGLRVFSMVQAVAGSRRGRRKGEGGWDGRCELEVEEERCEGRIRRSGRPERSYVPINSTLLPTLMTSA